MEKEKTYNKIGYLKTVKTKIVDINENGIFCEKTIFFAGGGGQPADKGILFKIDDKYIDDVFLKLNEHICAIDYDVTFLDGVLSFFHDLNIFDKKVFEIVELVSVDGEIFHKVKEIVFDKNELVEGNGYLDKSKNVDTEARDYCHEKDFSIGDNIIMILDIDNRLLNSQRHCGEHIVSGLFWKHYKAVNKGFHMGEHYITIDLKSEEYPIISYEMAKKIEIMANKVIWDDLNISVELYKDETEMRDINLRKDLFANENISVVTVGDKNNVIDCVGCCGTHPKSTGEIGLIKIYKIEKYKDMWRLYLECGRKALEDYIAKHGIVSTLCVLPKFYLN